MNNPIINKQELVLLRPQVVDPLLHHLLHKPGQDLDNSAIETGSKLAMGCTMRTQMPWPEHALHICKQQPAQLHLAKHQSTMVFSLQSLESMQAEDPALHTA